MTAFFVALIGWQPGGVARVLGSAGVAVSLMVAAAYATRHYREGVPSPLPTTVARVHVRAHPNRVHAVATVTLALGLPVAGVATALALHEAGWMTAAAVLLLGSAVLCFRSPAARPGRLDYDWERTSDRVTARAPVRDASPNRRARAAARGARGADQRSRVPTMTCQANRN